MEKDMGLFDQSGTQPQFTKDIGYGEVPQAQPNFMGQAAPQAPNQNLSQGMANPFNLDGTRNPMAEYFNRYGNDTANKPIFTALGNDILSPIETPMPVNYNFNQLGQTTPTPNPYGTNPYINSTNPYIKAANATASGNITAANAATAANRVNQNTPYGSLQYQQTGTDANGNPIWSANQTLSRPLENLTNTALGNLQSSLNNPMYGINPGQTYSDAIMSRLQPQIAHQNEMSDQQLANQGIMPGSQAYENAKRVLGQQQNDLLTSAIVNGMQTGLQAQNLQNTTAANIKALGTPNYVNPYNQPAVAAPDYLGAYSTANAADIAKANAEMARQTNLTNGLLGLGSSALLGGTGTGSVLGSIGGGLTDLYKYFNSLNPAIASGQNPAFYSMTGLTGNEFNTPLPDDTSAFDLASQYF
jgi:hypothetical protein